MLLNQGEKTLVRTWIRGIPLATYDDQLAGDQNSHYTLKMLRQRLALKARRLRVDWQGFFLQPRQMTEEWEAVALKRFDWLLAKPDITPCPTDPLFYWLDDAWITFFEPQGIFTIDDWLTWRRQQPADYWRTLPGLGEIGARQLEQRIQTLLPEHYATSLLPTLASVVYEAAAVPLEHFLVPVDLDGTEGIYRSHGDCFIPANNDFDAIQCWLSRIESNGHTYRAYKREAERLLLWAVLENHKALSSLTSVDMTAYRRFLMDPQPFDRWVGPNQQKSRVGKLPWKPFQGSLSPRSINHAETILGHLFNYLLNNGYVRHNPLSGRRQLSVSKHNSSFDTHRFLSESQWQTLCRWLEEQIPPSPTLSDNPKIRLRLIMKFLYVTGLRLHELAQATWGDIMTIERQSKTQRWLKVIGKGGKYREVPLTAQTVLMLLAHYRQLTGLTGFNVPTTYPLIPGLRGPIDQALSPKAIYTALKAGFQQAATDLFSKDPESAIKFDKATTHWLRHTHGTHSVDRGMSLQVLQGILGHSNISVTSMYLHAEKDEAFNAISILDE